MGTVRIKAGKVRPLWAGHPWVFAQAIARIDGAPGPGDPVRVVDPEGKYLGSGFYSPKSAIPVRLMTHRPDEALDGVAIGRRLEAALSLRKTLGLPSDENTGYRLVNAEGDHLPGLIVDVFDDTAVVQLGTVGMKSREEEIFAQVQRVVGAKTVIEMGADHQRGEGFISETRIARGEDRDALRFRENGFAFDIPRTLSHKTGYYFDQRANRLRVGQLAEGKRVLDAYSYLGGFALAASRGGASEVVAIERSAPAVAAAASIAHKNGQHISYHRDDVKKALPRLQSQKERFDIVIVDPPKLAPTRRHLERAKPAYRRLNALAIRLIEDGGMLVSCSCSAALQTTDFLRLLTTAARDAGARLTLLEIGTQGPDHPVPAAFPEGRYLEAMFLRVDR